MLMTTQYEQDKDLIVVKGEGELSFDEVMDNIESFYNRGPTSNVLWDLLEVSESSITSEQIHQIAEILSKFRKSRKEGKTAIVASQNVVFGLSRMLNTILDFKDKSKLVTMKIFYDMEVALEWVSGNN